MVHKPLLQCLMGQNVEKNPIWLMRQAGRYLPEYRALREKASGFLDLCLTPSLAKEITLQPIRRFDMDGAIVFADILLVPYAFGQDLVFQAGEGPVLEPVQDTARLKQLVFDVNRLAPVFETLESVKADLPDHTALIGFCGGPFTVACYSVNGRGGGKDGSGFHKVLRLCEDDPAFMEALQEKLLEATFAYLCEQIQAGAEVIQIFESWAGLLHGAAFRKWVIEPTHKLVSALETKYPNIPIIGFPRGAGAEEYLAFVAETGVDALGLDQHVSLDFAQDHLQDLKPLQGNMAPELLVEGGAAMQEAVEKILEHFGPNHIFNLGHGVLPETPAEHVAELVRLVREAEWQRSDHETGDHPL